MSGNRAGSRTNRKSLHPGSIYDRPSGGRLTRASVWGRAGDFFVQLFEMCRDPVALPGGDARRGPSTLYFKGESRPDNAGNYSCASGV